MKCLCCQAAVEVRDEFVWIGEPFENGHREAIDCYILNCEECGWFVAIDRGSFSSTDDWLE